MPTRDSAVAESKPSVPPIQDVIETQWQFVTDDPGPLHAQLESRTELAGFSLVRLAPLDLTDRYIDTADLRLARAGLALRLRSDGRHNRATLKSLHADSTSPKQRRRITQPMDDGRIESLLSASGPVAERTRTVASGAALEAVFTARTHREVFRALQGGVDVAAITLDSTELGHSGDAAASDLLRRVEVDLHGAAVGAVQPLVDRLRESALLEPALASKFVTGLASVGRTLPAPPEPGTALIAAGLSAAAAGQFLLRHQLAMWRSLQPAVCLGEDPESLHQLRVTGRRLLAVLQLLEAAPLAGANRLRPRLRALLRRSSAARDLDVQHAQIEAVDRTAADGALQPLLNELARRRAQQQRALLRALDSLRARQLFLALDKLASRPPRRPPLQPAVVAAERLIRRRFRKARRAALLMDRSASAENLHALRLEAKKLRYVAEPSAAVFGAPLQRFLRRLQRLQNVLGRINDAHQAMTNLEALVRRRRNSLPPGAIFAMGRMTEQQHQHLLAERAKWPQTWESLSGKRWRRLRRCMKERVAGTARPNIV